MAESTRLRTQEEALKKLELRIQEVADELREQIERNSAVQDAKMDARFNEYKGELNTAIAQLMQVFHRTHRTPGHLGSENDERPLLNNPVTNGRRAAEGENSGGWCEKMSRAFMLGQPKVELTHFTGDRQKEWIRRCEKFFALFQIPDLGKMELAELYLDGKIDLWYDVLKKVRGEVSWTEFKEELLERFGEELIQDEVEEFNKLLQTGAVEQYQEKFEELKSVMWGKNPVLTESYFLSSFLSGLREDIKATVKMLQPKNLREAYKLAKLQE